MLTGMLGVGRSRVGGMPKELKLMLKHLVISPRSGLGNRLRAIASARRLCDLCGARCTVHWTWGNFEDFFSMDGSLDWTPVISAYKKNYRFFKLLITNRGGTPENRRVWISKYQGIIVDSCHIFNSFEENKLISYRDLQPWLMRPAEPIQAAVRSFATRMFTRTVGMHMRRTDNAVAKTDSPDDLFFAEAESVIQRGYNIFLATDDRDTAAKMLDRFPGKIITYPKKVELERRWPRPSFDFDATVDDLIEMHLLAACEFVVGCTSSSYTTMARLYNGSPECKTIKRESHDI